MTGLRFFVKRPNGIALNSYVVDHQLADYIPTASSDNFAVRECCKLMISATGCFEDIVNKRSEFHNDYTAYLDQRNRLNPVEKKPA
jgi:hypothetical protein